jgi:PAS domain S-box-containing protein
MKKLREELRAGKPIDIEYRVRSVDRGWRWMRLRGTPSTDPSGEIVCWYGSVEDIEDRKQMEEARRKNRA